MSKLLVRLRTSLTKVITVTRLVVHVNFLRLSEIRDLARLRELKRRSSGQKCFENVSRALTFASDVNQPFWPTRKPKLQDCVLGSRYRQRIQQLSATIQDKPRRGVQSDLS